MLTPSAIDTAIAHTARVRPDRYGTDDTADGKMVVDGLAAMTSTGIPPTDVVAPVLDAVRTGTFLIPTKPSYADQIRNRFEALLDRRVPGHVTVD